MKDLYITRTPQFTEDMERLRRACFPGEYPAGTSMDRFDERSIHIVAYAVESLAACGRLTPGPDSFFECWTRGQAEIPVGKDVADLGRCVVDSTYRGLGLLRLICLEGLIAAQQLGFTKVVGAVIPGEPFEKMLHEIGLEPSGPTVDEIEPSGETFHIQPLVCDVGSHSYRWPALRESLYAKLHAKGYVVRLEQANDA